MVDSNTYIQREPLDLSVGDGLRISAVAYLGAATPKGLIWCVPGGGVDHRYWDVPVQGLAEDDYSFPYRAVAAGYLVVTADHLGAGGSSRLDDADQDRVVDAMSSALALARSQLGAEHLPSVGVGHSMGSGFTLHQQDRHHDHQGLVITGWSNIALTLPYADGQMYPLGTPGQPDMRRHNHGPGVPRQVIEANRAIRTDTPQPALTWVIVAGRLADAARRVDVPVLLAHGREDVSADPAADAALYEHAPSVESIVLPTSHHWHSGSPDRHFLWDSIVDWVDRRVCP